MGLDSAQKRKEVNERKQELGLVKNDPNISPAERSALIREIDDLEREALECEAEAGETQVAAMPPAAPEGAAKVETSAPLTPEEADENRERIAEEDDAPKSDEELTEGAEEFHDKAKKSPKEAKETEKKVAARISKAQADDKK